MVRFEAKVKKPWPDYNIAPRSSVAELNVNKIISIPNDVELKQHEQVIVLVAKKEEA